MPFSLKRVYDPPARTDGMRVLVDGLWPRGLTKEKAEVDEWCKAIAPSAELRRWAHTDRTRWQEFRSRYRHELDENGDSVTHLKALARKRRVTLLYGARDPDQNHAVVLLEYLRGK